MSKPFQLKHPVLVALLAVIFVTLVLSSFEGGSGFVLFGFISWIVILGTAAIFALLYVLVLFAQTIYKRRNRSDGSE